MAKCPKCGFEVANPLKSWQMARRLSEQGDIQRLTIGFYQCPNCSTKFRRALAKERINLKAVLERIKLLEEIVVEATRKRSELEEKLRALEEEKASLITEIEALKAIPELEAKLASLEPEVAQLREEKKVLEEKITSPTMPPKEEHAPVETPAEAPAEIPSPAEAPAQTEAPAEDVAPEAASEAITTAEEEKPSQEGTP